MGRFPRLVPRLINNFGFHLRQTNRVCPKQLLDAALLAPSLPPAAERGVYPQLAGLPEPPAPTASAQSGNKDASSELKQAEAGRGQAPTSLHADTWAVLETHALLALPSLSPAGILQFLFLTLRKNYFPKEFLDELSRFLLVSEPLAPPVSVYWQLWTANDLAVFYKLLIAHGVSDSALFAQVRERMAACMQHFTAADVALVLSAAADTPASSLTLALLRPHRHRSIAAAAAATAAEAAEVAAARAAAESAATAVPTAEAPAEAPAAAAARAAEAAAAAAGEQALETRCLSLNSTESPLFVSLLHAFAKQLTSNAACQAGSELGDLQHAFEASLDSLLLITWRLQRCLLAASSKAKLRIIAACVSLCLLLQEAPQQQPVSLHAAVASAVEAAGRAASVPLAVGVPSGESSSAACTPLSQQMRILLAFKAATRMQSGNKSVVERTKKEGQTESPKRETLNAAVEELLAVCLCDLNRWHADLSPKENMRLLDLLWRLVCGSKSFLPFSWFEGLLFSLAANASDLTPHELLGLRLFVVFCLSTGDEKEKKLLFARNALLFPGLPQQELHVERELQTVAKKRAFLHLLSSTQKANLLQERLQDETAKKHNQLSTQEKSVFEWLDNLSAGRLLLSV